MTLDEIETPLTLVIRIQTRPTCRPDVFPVYSLPRSRLETEAEEREEEDREHDRHQQDIISEPRSRNGI
jgi:hypothetical protein